MRGRWDTKNNHQDYGIARNFGSGLLDRRTGIENSHLSCMKKLSSFYIVKKFQGGARKILA